MRRVYDDGWAGSSSTSRRHWAIVEGEIWAQFVMARAEAIISVETERVVTLAAGPMRPRMYVDLGTVLDWIQRARDKGQRGNMALESHARTTDRFAKPASVAIAEDDYAEKLIQVSTRAQVQALRRVRGGD